MRSWSVVRIASTSSHDVPEMGASVAGRRHWVEAARPRTRVAGAVPVVVGTAASGSFIAWRFVAAVVVALSLQVAVNYANDLFDASRGVDTPDRIGPRRAVASGLISPSRMKLGGSPVASGPPSSSVPAAARLAASELIRGSWSRLWMSQ